MTRSKKKRPILSALSIWLVLTALGLIAGVLITRSTGSYYGGLIASNVGSLLGIALGVRVYQTEKTR